MEFIILLGANECQGWFKKGGSSKYKLVEVGGSFYYSWVWCVHKVLVTEKKGFCSYNNSRQLPRAENFGVGKFWSGKSTLDYLYLKLVDKNKKL